MFIPNNSTYNSDTKLSLANKYTNIHHSIRPLGYSSNSNDNNSDIGIFFSDHT